MQPQGPPKSRWTLSGGITTLAIVLGLGIPAAVTDNLYRQYRQELRAAEINTANTSRALEQHAARTVETVDTYLQAVVSLVGSPDAGLPPETIYKALRDKLSQSKVLTNILILDARGVALYEAGAFPARPVDRSTDDYLQMLRDDPGAGLVVGAPITGRFTKLPVLPVARRINHADGSFAGIILATLKASAFQSVFDGFDLGPGSTMSLWRSDGTLLVRAPQAAELIGRNYSGTENYRRYILPKVTKPFWAIGSTDGVERVLALGFVPSYPLYVSSAQSRDTALAGWRGTAWVQGGIAGGLTLVVVVALLALAREFRRRRDGEQALKTSEAMHRLLSENATDMIAVSRTFEDRRSYVSPSSVRVAGWSPDDLMAMPPSDYVHPEDLGRVRDEYASLAAATPIVTSLHRIRHKAGHWIWVEATFGLVGAGTSEERVIATSRDVTARRQAEEAVTDSEARYRLLTETSSDMIVLIDLGGVRRYVSPASRALMGYEPEELVGERVGSIFHPDHAEAITADINRVRQGALDCAAGTHRFLRKDGSEVWVDAQFRAVRTAGEGEISGYIAVIRDVSERQRQAEELRLAKDAAEAAAAAKGEFLAIMSHELRTPLNSIIGFAGLMLDSPELQSALMRRYVRLIQDASTTLLSMVNDVLDLSKLEAGGFELDPKPFSPRDLIQSAAALLQQQADEKRLALHTEVDPTVPERLVGDDIRLRQVLLNLLSNAVKFTAKGMVWLFVDCEGEADGLARIRFTVMDTGIGIPRDKRHRLFQPFSQVDSSTARQFGGTGLGLSICKSLIETMDGTIEAESTEGEGSTFSFVLDLPVAAAEKPAAGEAATTSLATARHGVHILLAEDVAMNQELAVAMLSRWGHTVAVVADGAAAVDAVLRDRYDLVLMDVQMPVMDGLEATRRIRSLGGSFETLPILAMTANVTQRDVERCRAAGLDDHISKPFLPETLRTAIETWTRPKPVAETGTRSARRHEQALLDELQGIVGAEALATMLEQFETELHRWMEPDRDDADWSAVARDAHTLVSTAGQLGFASLSEACRTLEDLVLSPGRDEGAARRQLVVVHAEVVQASAEAARLRKDLLAAQGV